ncbi:MAG: 1-aminocyclopropane-1-carboxylate deaminase/D-cysteine desulfhydrase [Myxococcota bacterium]
MVHAPARIALLGTYPTLVERLDGLSRPGTALWVKRDDRTGTLYGGNKVRKLERLLPEARTRGATRLVTVGAVGSHHVLATAIWGGHQGFAVEAVLVPQPATEHARANLRAGLAAGLRPFPVRSVAGVPFALLERLRGGDAFHVPAGGSSVSGAMGYLDAARELAAQVRAGEMPEPDVLVVALGSGGTAAGLAAGLAIEGLRTRVVAVAVWAPVWALAARTRWLAGNCLARAAARRSLRLEIERGYLGRGYGYPSLEGERASAIAARVGLALDATYTAKAFAAALDLVDAGSVRTVLYWHTLSSVDLSALVAKSPATVDGRVARLWLSA